MILIEIVCRQELAINRLCAALNEAADSFKNAGLSVDAEDCERVIEESLSGGNPGEPKACTGAEERGISGATGAGQHPDGNPESTGDSADRRSPGGTERTPSPDESHRHFERGCHIIMELMQAYERRVRSDCTPEQIEKRPWECAEYLKAAEYLRNVWPPHEPPQLAEATECRYCDEVMKERDDYHEWADTLAHDIERLVGVEIGEHSSGNAPWGNAHDAAEYELDKRARQPHEPQPSEARGDDLAGWLEEMHDYARPIDQPKLMQAAALLRSSHEPEGVLALVKQKRDEYRSFLDAGKGTWPGSDYIQDETWARWQGAWSVLDSIVSQAERERPCLFDKLVGNPLDGFPSTKLSSHEEG